MNRIRSGGATGSRAVFRLLVGLLLLASLGSVIAQEPLYVLPGPNEPVISSGTMTLVGNDLLVTNALSNSVSRVALRGGILQAELETGRQPHGIAADGDRAYAINRQDGTLTRLALDGDAPLDVSGLVSLGALPYGVIARDGQVLVSLQGEAALLLLDGATGGRLARIPTPPNPTTLALWGDLLLVAHDPGGLLSLVHLPQRQVVQTIQLASNATRIGTPLIDNRSGRAYVPHSLANPGVDVPPDARLIPVVSVVDLATMQPLPEAQLFLPTVDRLVNLPGAAALDRARNRLYVAHVGSGSVSVIDLRAGLAQANVPTGTAPRTLLLSRDALSIYSHDVIDQTVTVIDVSFLMPTDSLPTSDISVSPDLQLGARLFHTAADPRLNAPHALSCAACHQGGLSMGVAWGGVDAPLLWHVEGRSAYGRRGQWASLFDLNAHFQANGGSGLAHDSLDAAALVRYLESLSAPAPPRTDGDAVLGGVLFARWGCAGCHLGGGAGDGQLHDVGTGGAFLTSDLRGLWASAPYLHDGSVASLRTLFTLGTDVHRLPETASQSELQALIAYLHSLR